MKKVLLMMVGAALSTGAWAQAEEVQEESKEVIISSNLARLTPSIKQELEAELQALGAELEALGTELDSDFDFSFSFDDDDDDYRERRRFRTESNWNLEVGLNNYMTSDFGFPDQTNELYTLDTWGSPYIAVTRNYSTKVAGPLYIEYGGSISWYNFRFINADTRVQKDIDQLVFYSDSSNVVPVRSKLMMPFLNVHFVPVLDLSKGTFDRSYQGKGFRIGAGGYAGYRIGGRTKYVYEENGDKQKAIDKDNFYVNNIRYGVRGQIGFKGVDLFVNYDLNELFADGRGPELNALSFGLIF